MNLNFLLMNNLGKKEVIDFLTQILDAYKKLPNTGEVQKAIDIFTAAIIAVENYYKD